MYVDLYCYVCGCIVNSFVARVSLTLKAVQCCVSGGVARCGVKEVWLKFDSHQIFTMEEFVAVFPHKSEQLAEERNRIKEKLERQKNSLV